ncbi:MAG TPA: TRAP transporter substrate-binding protein [Bacillales bacterium]|nr:TRAP transporter substrate-binding protein [Bacillales bacterium]
MKIKIIAIFSLILLLIAAAGCSNSSAPNSSSGGDQGSANGGDKSSGEKITIKVNNDVAADTLKGQSWRHFKEVLESSSVGDRVDVQIYDSGSLFAQSKQLQALQQNQIQLMAPVPGVLSGQFPKLQAFGLPYLFKSPDMISAAIADPNIGAKLFAGPEEKGVKITNVWLNGWRMVSASKPINTIDDLKGVKIRVPGGKNYVNTFKALGADVITIDWGEVPSSLQQGVIDAVEPTPNANVSAKIYELAKYTTTSDHILDIYVICANKQWLESLPTDVKKEVEAALKDTEKWNWEQAQKANEDALQKQIDGGGTVIKLSNDELAKWQEATKPVIDSYKDVIGEDILSAIQDLAKEYEWKRPSK